MMKFVLAPDSFKESMTATEAVEAMELGIRDVLPDAHVARVPMSDGGEGFVDVIAHAWDAAFVHVATVDALGRPLDATYALAGTRAVMDVASCAGLELIERIDRDVVRSNSAGLGILMRDAVERGAKEILIGLGGSATNDAGIGMLHSLGARFVDKNGAELPPFLMNLGHIASVDSSQVEDLMGDVTVRVACDVTNPLTGPSGATAVFGPQKGVLPSQVESFDSLFAHFAHVSGHDAQAVLPGAGAAGGLGFALRAFCGATLQPGVELVVQAVGLADVVNEADWVFTGEGSVDVQTLQGKTPAGVVAVARAAHVSTVIFAGKIKEGAEVLREHGVARIVSISPRRESLDEALRNGRNNLRKATAQTVAQLNGL